MNVLPALTTVKDICQSTTYGRFPLSLELFADTVSPMEVLRILKNISSHAFMLESAEDNQHWGRYTFLGFHPSLELTCYDRKVTCKTASGKVLTETDPDSCIRRLLAENHSPTLAGLPPFTGGLAGYFSYDYIKYSEPSLTLNALDKEGFADVNLMLFDKIICFDHYRQKIILIINFKPGVTDLELERAYEEASLQLIEMAEIIKNGVKAPSHPLCLKTPFTPLFDQTAYCRMVEKAKHFIREGDIFQVVLSNRLEADMEGSLLDTYRLLRTSNPSPYMFYFSGGDGEIAGASPETLVKLEKGKLFTFPLAGTRRRGVDEAEDELLKKELLADEKELAEHNMLVDLGRNDLGKISQIGSVHVEKYLSVECFSHVMHLGSTVSGKICKDKDGLDAIHAVLPAGTLSGAPKLRACEIINELENNKRGIYGGAIGYLSFTGDMDTCIAIRLAFSKNGKVFIRSGAGIVADSVPEKEYAECIQKAAAVKNAIQQSVGGI